jgi:uncharacterized protein YciI
MATFVLTCLDHPNNLERRMGAREAHLAYVKEHLSLLKLAGPLLDDAGQMAGSMFILDVADKAAVEAFNAADPYTKAGVFASVTIQAMKITVGVLANG